jgi:hypothetical protein
MVIISCARDAMIRMVVFDVGETLVDETRQWSEWAEWLHVPKFTFFAAFGAVIASGSHHREVFRLVANLDFRQAIEKRIESRWRYEIRATDFYPDALPCLEKLRAEGRKLGVSATNQRPVKSAFGASGSNWISWVRQRGGGSKSLREGFSSDWPWRPGWRLRGSATSAIILRTTLGQPGASVSGRFSSAAVPGHWRNRTAPPRATPIGRSVL